MKTVNFYKYKYLIKIIGENTLIEILLISYIENKMFIRVIKPCG